MSATANVTTEPTMYCRRCQYVLDGLPENRCPECGTNFDPTHPATFLRGSDLRDHRRYGSTSIVSLRIQLCLAAFFFGWGMWTTFTMPQQFNDYLVRCVTMPLALWLCLRLFWHRWRLTVIGHLVCALLLLFLAILTPLFIYGALTVKHFANR